ncbi:alpha/beta fold hydrolase [Pseudalkalibacillus caeni]|uniref:alpha/beta fold hydrolase n=1 Tax=Exobacillus caeni TaxID=2574798 RepID=UPI001485898D|nr:alpha/beta fold hydrolase [Pseudalkalibacillus caeni]
MKNEELIIVANGVSHWVKIAGAEHNTIPLIIVHGGPGGNQQLIQKTLGPELEKFSTVIFYEQRGCGRSSRPCDAWDYSMETIVSDLDSIVDHLQLDTFNLLGTSFGGEIAMEYTVAHQEKVHKLLLQGPVDGNWERLRCIQFFGYQFVAKGEAKGKIQQILSEDGTYEERSARVRDVIDLSTIARLSIYKEELIPEAMKEMEKFEGNGDYHLAITSRKQNKQPLLDRITTIKTPTLIIVGLHDRNTGIEMSRDIHAKIDGSKLVILEKSAHYPEVDEPERYMEEIKQFIETREDLTQGE